MSLFFSLGLSDPVPFGVCGIQTAEAGQFGSTTDNMYVRMFTNDTGENYKILAGMALGTSNISGTGVSAIQNAYLGPVQTNAQGSNYVLPSLAVQQRRVGVNYPHTMRAALDVYGADSNTPIALFSSYAKNSSNGVVITKAGTLGIGTSNPNEQFAVDVRGGLVACNILLNTLSGTYPQNTVLADYCSLSNLNYVRSTHVYMDGAASNASEALLQVRVPGFTALNVKGTGTTTFGSERVFDPMAILTIDGSAYACNIYLNTLQGLQANNTVQATGIRMSNAHLYHGQAASLDWTGAAPSSNILLISSTRGAQGVITSDGRWGIQTTLPNSNAELDVIGDIYACNIVTPKLLGTGTGLIIDTQASTLSNITRIETTRADIIYTGTSNTLRIFNIQSTASPSILNASANGRIGIGTSTPNSNALVDILGSVYSCNLRTNSLQPASGTAIDLTNITTLSNATLLHTQQVRVNYTGGASNSNQPIVQTTGTGSFTVLSSGRVGVQTTSVRSNVALDIIGNLWTSNATLSSLTGTLGGSNRIDCTLASLSNASNLQADSITINHRFSVASNSVALQVTNTFGDARAVTITGNGRIGVGTTMVTSSDSNLLLDVRGHVSACNVIMSRIQGALAGSNIDYQQSSASNLNSVFTNQVRLTYSGASNNYLLVDTSSVTTSSFPITVQANGQVGLGTSAPTSNVRLDVSGNIRASNISITSITGLLSNATIDATKSTLSNLDRLVLNSEIRMKGVPLFDSNGLINPDVSTTRVLSGGIFIDEFDNVVFTNSNNFIYNRSLQRVGIKTGSPQAELDVNGTIIAGTGIQTSNIIPTSAGGTITFNYGKIIEVDQLIVRSNITIEVAGLNTITNLPSDVVRSVGGAIDPSFLPVNVVTLNESNQIDAALIPVAAGPTTTTIRTLDSFGIGIRRPSQRLHVNNGNSVLTGGFFGVGLSNPTAAIHVQDSNGPSTTLLIEQYGNRNPIQVLGLSSTPIFTMTSTGRVGMGTHASSNSDGLHVNSGIARFAQGMATPLLYSSMNAQAFAISNIGTLQAAAAQFTNANISQRVGINTTTPLYDLDVRGQVNITGTANMARILPNNGSNTLVCAGALHVQGATITANSLSSMQAYLNPNNIPASTTSVGIYVDNYVQSAGYYATSDERFKKDIKTLDPGTSLEKIRIMRPCTYAHRDPVMGPATIGFIAQEIKETVPEAVTLRDGFVPDIMQRVTFLNAYQFYLDPLLLPKSSLPLGPMQRIRIELPYSPPSSTGPYYYTIKDVRVDLEEARLLITVSEPLPFDPPLAGKPLIPAVVYGRWAHDIHTMDYDRLVALHTSAIQALLARVEELERKLAAHM